MSTDRELRRRAQRLANVFKWPIRIAQLAGVVVASPAATTVLLLTHRFPALARFVLGLVTFVALGAATYLVALRPRTRQALEMFAWLGDALQVDHVERVLGSGDERPEVRAAAAALENPEEVRDLTVLQL